MILDQVKLIIECNKSMGQIHGKFVISRKKSLTFSEAEAINKFYNLFILKTQELIFGTFDSQTPLIIKSICCSIQKEIEQQTSYFINFEIFNIQQNSYILLDRISI